MKNSCILFVCLVLIVVLPSCHKIIGKGPVVSENRTLSGFEGLTLDVPGNAYFTQSPVYSIELRAQQNILDEIETVVNNGDLKIRFRHSGADIRTNEQISVYVTAPNSRSLVVNGSGTLNVSPLTTSAMRLLVSGSGSIRADNIEASTIEATMSGSGIMKVNTGTANSENAIISGSGMMDLGGVTVKDALTYISGSAVIKVNASKTLLVHISGSGTVYYYGTPVITSQVSGSGSVVKL